VKKKGTNLKLEIQLEFRLDDILQLSRVSSLLFFFRRSVLKSTKLPLGVVCKGRRHEKKRRVSEPR